MVGAVRRSSLSAVGAAGVVVTMLVLTARGWQAGDPALRLAEQREAARRALDAGDRAEAARSLERVLALDPADLRATLQLAELERDLGRPQRAAELLRAALTRHHQDLRALATLAPLLERDHQPAGIVALLAPRLPAIEAQGPGPVRAALLVTLGRALARLGQVERGLELLRRAVRDLEPSGDPAGLMALGEALRGAGRWKEAEAPLREAHRAAPHAQAPTLELARLLARLGRPGEAAQLLRRLLAERPALRLELGPELGQLLVAAEQLDAAARLADELAAEGGEAEQGAVAALRGWIALAQGRLTGAREQLQEAARRLPQAAAPRLHLARVETLAGDVAAARRALEDALQVAPGLTEAEVALLELEERQGHTTALRARALRLLGSAEARPQALRTLLLLYARDHDPHPAQERLRALREAAPDDRSLRLLAALFQLLGDEPDLGAEELTALAAHPGLDLPQAFGLGAPGREGQAQEALELLAWIASQDPRLAPARVLLASTWERLGRADLALRELDLALEADQGLQAALLARARLRARAGELSRATSDLEQLRAGRPEDSRLLGELGELYLRRELVEQGLPLLARAAEQAPEDAAARARLGRAQVLSGDLAGALRSFAAARWFDPHLAGAHQDAAVHLLQGDPMAAAEAWRRARQETGDPRLGIPLACAMALLGQPRPALAELEAALGGAPLLRALCLHLSGETRAGQALLTGAGAPPEASDGLACLDATGARPALESCALSALGWGPEVRARAARLLAAEQPNAFLLHLAASFPAVDADPELRLRLARRLAELVQRDPRPGLSLADAQAEVGDAAHELVTLEELAHRFPEDRAVTLRLGEALEARGESERALAHYARAAASGPGEDEDEAEEGPAAPADATLLARVRARLAALLARDPLRRPLAVEHARRAARLAPRDGRVLDTLGWLLLEEGQLTDAERLLTEAVAQEPARPLPRWHLAQALEARGARVRAESHLRVALLGGQPFPERAQAQERLTRLSEELRAPATPPVELAPGGNLELTTGEQGLARVRIPGTAAPRLAGLRLQAPPGCAASATCVGPGGEVEKRLEAAPGETVFLPRFALGPAGMELVVRVDARYSGTSVHLTLGEPATGLDADGGVNGEVEPDDDAGRAAALRPGHPLRGRLDGPADRDHLRLELGPGRAARLVLTAGVRGPVQVTLLGGAQGEGRRLRTFPVAAGSALELDPLTGAGEALRLRIEPAGPLAAGVADGDAWDWSAELEAVEPPGGPDREPNDRPEDAARVTQGSLSGRLGPGDQADWLRLEAPAGAVLALALQAEAPLQLEVWEPAGGLLPRRIAPVPEGGDGVALPRWRVPSAGELLLCVRRAPGRDEAEGAERSWRLSIGPAAGSPSAQPAETESNDLSAHADALPLDVVWRGALDVPLDRDWGRAPAPAGGLIALRLVAPEGAPPLDGVAAGIYAPSPAGPRLLGRWLARGRELRLPALELPPGCTPWVLLRAPSERGPGAYELTLSAGDRAGEVEPDDLPEQAIALAPGARLDGLLCGSADRDLLRVAGPGALIVRARGAWPVEVTRLSGAGVPVRVAAGEEVRLALDARGGVIQLALPADAGPASDAPWQVERTE